jgi:TrbL/VirB6 plasmid conjugal transfer protein
MLAAAANPDNLLSTIAQDILQMMTANESLFTSMGITIYRSFALISVVWFGVETMLSGRGFHPAKFANLIMLLAFGYAMTTYYSNPIPGIGYSFSHLVTEETHSLSSQIEQATTGEIMTAMGTELSQMQTPSVSALLDILVPIRYFVIMFVLTGAELALVVMISFGFAAQAVCVLLGPIFIPFFIVPKLDFLFWGWLKAFLQFSFYSVVANAYVYVFGSALLNFWKAHNQPLTNEYAAEIFVEVVIIQMLFIFGMIKVPSLVAAIFSGSNGGFGFRVPGLS